MMDMYVKSLEPHRALELWQEMLQNSHIKPNLVAYNVALKAVAGTYVGVVAIDKGINLVGCK